VPDYQLSLAIGKEGQNARLAARLTGWRIDIKSETQVSEDRARAQAAQNAAPAAPVVEAPAPVATPAVEAPVAPAADGPIGQPAAVEQGGS